LLVIVRRYWRSPSRWRSKRKTLKISSSLPSISRIIRELVVVVVVHRERGRMKLINNKREKAHSSSRMSNLGLSAPTISMHNLTSRRGVMMKMSRNC
jgi:hypothetical protein